MSKDRSGSPVDKNEKLEADTVDSMVTVSRSIQLCEDSLPALKHQRNVEPWGLFMM